MSTIQIHRKFEIDAGHRVLGHGGKCAHVHGHRYQFIVVLSAPALDDLGMVLDFGLIKQWWGTWLDDEWDHGMLLYDADPLVSIWCDHLPEHKLFTLPYNPTAENLARYLAQLVWPQFQRWAEEHDAGDLELVAITCRETPNCAADWVAA